jgi:hypothetical protein
MKFRSAVVLSLLCTTPVLASHTAGMSFMGGKQFASPINTESAITAPKGNFNVGARYEYRKFQKLSIATRQELKEANHDADLHSADSMMLPSFSLSYGVTDDLTVGIRVPLVFRYGIEDTHLEEEEEDGEHHHHGHIENIGDNEGVGDTLFFGQYRFYKDEETKTHLSLLLGVNAPTGDVRESVKSTGDHNGTRFETELQPGSGAWNGLLGLALTKQVDAMSFDSSVMYSISSEGAQGSDLGDSVSYNISSAYRLPLASLAELFNKSALDFVLEFNGQYQDNEEQAGVKVGNSGGNSLYISPGLRFVSGSNRWNNWNVGTSFGYPIVDDANGDQDDLDYRILGTVNVNF